jgi:hypothetical protein
MLDAGWSPNDDYVYALVVLLGTLVAVIALRHALGSSRWSAAAHSLEGVAPPFINAVAVLFGLTLAFLANDTWSAHDAATKTVSTEARALHAIEVLSQSLAPAERQRLHRALAAYARASIDEWPRLAVRADNPEVSRRADDVLRELAGRDVETAVGAATQSLMLSQAAVMVQARDQRVALSHSHVNPLKWLEMGFLGFLTLLSVAVAHIARPRAALAAMILFSLAAAPTAAAVLVQANPFQPPVAVKPDALIRALATLREAD